MSTRAAADALKGRNSHQVDPRALPPSNFRWLAFNNIDAVAVALISSLELQCLGYCSNAFAADVFSIGLIALNRVLARCAFRNHLPSVPCSRESAKRRVGRVVRKSAPPLHLTAILSCGLYYCLLDNPASHHGIAGLGSERSLYELARVRFQLCCATNHLTFQFR